jgi:hypothetical protein
VFLLNIERFLSYLTFYPPKKVALTLIRAEKNVFKIVCKGIKRFLETPLVVFLAPIYKGVKMLRKRLYGSPLIKIEGEKSHCLVSLKGTNTSLFFP